MKKRSILRRKAEREQEALELQKEKEREQYRLLTEMKEKKDRERALEIEKERAIANILRKKQEDIEAKDSFILQRFAFQKQLREQAGQKMVQNFKKNGFGQSLFVPLNYRGQDLQSQAERHAEYRLRNSGLD